MLEQKELEGGIALSNSFVQAALGRGGTRQVRLVVLENGRPAGEYALCC